MSQESASPEIDRQADISPGSYLLHGYGTQKVDEIQVTQYDLKVSGGVKSHWDRENYTSSVAYFLDQEHGAPVAPGGQMSVVSKTSLSRSVSVWGKEVTPINPTTVSLDASKDDDRAKIKNFAQSCFKRAIPGDLYAFQFLNKIVRDEPEFTAGSKEFAAHPKHAVKIQVTAGGRVLVHVESGFSIRSNSTLDEVYSRDDNPYGKRVAHDPNRYLKEGQGHLRGWSDYHYTDHISEAGSSIAEMHEGVADEEWRQKLIEENPRLLNVKYGSKLRRQVPHFLRLSPRTEQVQDRDREFYNRFDRRSAMMPDERYELSEEFLSNMNQLPVIEMDLEPGPTNAPYDSLQMREVDRLAFGDSQYARDPGKGLRGHGVYKSPGQYRVGILAPERWDEEADELAPLIVAGLNDLSAPAGVTGYRYKLGDISNYTPVVHDLHDETDAVVAIIPDKGAAESFSGIQDPYSELKRTVLRKGIPTQMMQKSTVDELLGQQAGIGNDKFLNTLSAVVAKAGGTPWQIDSLPGETDAFMGLDVTYDQSSEQHSGASASVVLADGTTFAAESTTQQEGEKFSAKHVEQFVRDLVFDFAAEQSREINRLCIMRDGKIAEDIDAVRAGLAEVDAEIDIVGVRKSGQPRIAEYDGTRFRIAEKGVGFVDTDRSQAIVHAFGKPEIKDNNPVGTPQTFRLTKHSGPTDIETLTRQSYWLSEIHYGSPIRSPRLPVPIDYADMAAEYVREGYVSPGKVIKGPAYI